jgi:hypothetical protein
MADPPIGAALCAWLEGAERETPASDAQAFAAAEVWDMLAEAPRQNLDAAALARALSGAMSVAERDALLIDPAAPAQFEAAEDFLVLAADSDAPPRLLDEARRLLAPSAEIVALPRGVRRDLPAEVFRLRAAAGKTPDNALLCRSESGVWTLEVFVEQSGLESGGDLASILLSVDADYRATYEGRRAKVFVTVGEGERVLVEADVRDGELYADVSLAGLDLHERDAISVVFAPEADDAP